MRKCSRKPDRPHSLRDASPALSWALATFLFALIASVLGFTGLAGTAVGIAQVLFVVFLISLLVGRRRPAA